MAKLFKGSLALFGANILASQNVIKEKSLAETAEEVKGFQLADLREEKCVISILFIFRKEKSSLSSSC